MENGLPRGCVAHTPQWALFIVSIEQVLIYLSNYCNVVILLAVAGVSFIRWVELSSATTKCVATPHRAIGGH